VTFLAALVGVSLVSLTIVSVLAATAKPGYEDERGFHATPRQKSRRSAT
jgi:hypothetical protein